MPVYKASILNKEISINYELDQKEILEKAIDSINSKLKSYDNLNGKISDTKLLSFLAIELQSEILEFDIIKKNEIDLKKKYKDSNYENIGLNDKLYQLREQNKLLEKENDLIKKEITQIQTEIINIIDILKKTYET
tara:strand:- start:283 stop:690 length:408 start_codon:yes stop_codon:yes gene_type:complete